jgi:SSS family solute:Na+ symporter
MHLLDWIILVGFALSLFAVTYVLRRYTRSVTDFLAAGRCAKRYLLAVAEGASAIGSITIIAQFELYFSAGFTPAYWEMILLPLWLVLALLGWIAYRFRETRCLTMAQFLEVRYSRSFRILSGALAFFAGTLNYGIFPAVRARFFVYACDLPPELSIFGAMVPTFALIMPVLLGIALYVTLSGGQIAVIVTDLIQGLSIMAVFIVSATYVLHRYGWDSIAEAAKWSQPGSSRVNPFDTSQAETFGVWFFLILLFHRFYIYMTWLGTQGYNASAISPHEARMARILGQFRGAVVLLLPLIFATVAYTALQEPSLGAPIDKIEADLSAITNAQLQTQMTTPITIGYLLPAGLLGCFVAVMFAATVSTDSTYLHSWGSILIQDVIMPLRGRPFTPAQHLRLLRCSIVGVAVFAFGFSLWFQQSEYILLFMLLTGAFFTAGAGVCIIGGLYWKRGTTQGAWAAMITGVGLIAAGLIAEHTMKELGLRYHDITILSYFGAIVMYIATSLVTSRGRPAFNMDRMLHRGAYAIEDRDAPEAATLAKWVGRVGRLERRVGIDGDFTRGDKLVYWLCIALGLGMVAVFVGLMVWDIAFRPDEAAWMTVWKVFVTLAVSLLSVVFVWFLVGGGLNLRDLIHALSDIRRIDADDGFVARDHEQDARELELFAKGGGDPDISRET